MTLLFLTHSKQACLYLAFDKHLKFDAPLMLGNFLLVVLKMLFSINRAPHIL